VMEQPGEEVAAAVVAVHDVSHLRALDRMKTRFVSNVSHELRTPVANIKLYASMLRMGRRPEKTERYLEVLEMQSDQLMHLIQDILEITALDSGQAVISWEPIFFPILVGDAVARYQSQAKAAGLTLQAARLPPDLPTVQGDPARLSQALGELVENALIFTPTGGEVIVEVEILKEAPERWLTVAVRDTGPGISDGEQARVFDRFYRGSLAKSGHVPGAGLGLSIVDEIIRAHRGQVTIESKLGQGSTFTLWLPLGERQD
jgi:signal transduction histidine kinase